MTTTSARAGCGVAQRWRGQARSRTEIIAWGKCGGGVIAPSAAGDDLGFGSGGRDDHGSGGGGKGQPQLRWQLGKTSAPVGAAVECGYGGGWRRTHSDGSNTREEEEVKGGAIRSLKIASRTDMDLPVGCCKKMRVQKERRICKVSGNCEGKSAKLEGPGCKKSESRGICATKMKNARTWP
uniref:Uncharacterized protein n=1 Tax=Oryza barthii TaxID=65489 RepID=A0A0D3HV13_9ORYZ